jgi:hypothetical protein
MPNDTRVVLTVSLGLTRTAQVHDVYADVFDEVVHACALQAVPAQGVGLFVSFGVGCRFTGTSFGPELSEVALMRSGR